MPITPQDKKSLEDYILSFAQDLRAVMIRTLQKEAMEVVDNIRNYVEAGGYRKYKDQSGNLTSSIGYVLIDNGTVIGEYGFEQIKPTAIEGPPAGRNYATQLAASYTSGLGVIVVAGMNYAAYVEARNLGGMTAGEQALRNAIHVEMQELQRQLKARM